MDVVATPVGEDETAWWLTDRLGRPLGSIRTIPGSSEVTIVSETGSRLSGVPAHHACLDDALTTIEERMGGTCQLNPVMNVLLRSGDAPRHAPAEVEARLVRAHVREILRKIPSRKLDRPQQHS